MIRALPVLLALLCAAAAFNNPRVVLFDDPDDRVSSRSDAMQLCVSKGHCIAHDSQIVADLEQGYTGHHRCGFTWNSQDGRARHAHCEETDPNNPDHCLPGKSVLVNDKCHGREKFGAYCRVQRQGEDLPHPCKILHSDLVELYRLPGPFRNLDEAKAACTERGAGLAYWIQAAAYVDRYDVEFCDYNFLKVEDAVYRVNCKHSGEIEWRIMNSNAGGYGAVCHGRRPHPFETPCNSVYPTLASKDIFCDQEDWIVIQDRPPCKDEKNHFSGRTWDDYNEGFGSLDPKNSGYWLGLHPVYDICSEHKCRVRFEMFDQDDQFYWTEYKHFRLGEENEEQQPPRHYRLDVRLYDERSTAGNALQEIQSGGGSEDGSYFSYGHQDADSHDSLNCAVEFASGWWFSKCHRGNLNGVCDDETLYNPKIARCRFWSGVNGDSQDGVGLKRTRIKIMVENYHQHSDSESGEDN